MENFEYCAPTRFIFEPDADLRVGKEVKKYSGNVLFVHYGDGFMHGSGLYDRVTDSLKKENIIVYELSNVQPNPKLSLVREGVSICKKHNIGFVLAVGGGSVIDTAKAVAIGARSNLDVWDFFTKKAVVQDALKVGAIMTLPATGSEASGGAVIYNDETNECLDVIEDDFLRPVFALLNPMLTIKIPKKQTGMGIIDMFSHVLERYMSDSKNVYVTDYMCEGLMKAIIKNGYNVINNPDDIASRSELMWAAIVAHNGIIGIGRQQDWASHAIAAQLSSKYNITHGLALSVIIPSWAKQVNKYNKKRFIQFARNVFNVEMDYYDENKTIEEGIEKMNRFFIDMGGAKNFKELGIEDDSLIDKMAEDTIFNKSVGNIKKLNKEDIVEIYRRLI